MCEECDDLEDDDDYLLCLEDCEEEYSGYGADDLA